jgi:hypothetical protein
MSRKPEPTLTQIIDGLRAELAAATDPVRKRFIKKDLTHYAKKWAKEQSTFAPPIKKRGFDRNRIKVRLDYISDDDPADVRASDLR